MRQLHAGSLLRDLVGDLSFPHRCCVQRICDPRLGIRIQPSASARTYARTYARTMPGTMPALSNHSSQIHSDRPHIHLIPDALL
jgi:hypothetical protein